MTAHLGGFFFLDQLKADIFLRFYIKSVEEQHKVGTLGDAAIVIKTISVKNVLSSKVIKIVKQILH